MVYYPASLIYFFVFFTFYAYLAGRKQGVQVFWKNMVSPTVTSLATCSSAASIPANLEATKKMGISSDVRETVVLLGSTLHKDGSVLGGVLKLLSYSVFSTWNSGENISNRTCCFSISRNSNGRYSRRRYDW